MKHLKLFFALFAMLALGVGNAWAEESFTIHDKFTSTTMAYATTYKADISVSDLNGGNSTVGISVLGVYKQAKAGTTFQTNKKSGHIKNTSAIPGKITKIVVSHNSSYQKNALKVYGAKGQEATTQSTLIGTLGTKQTDETISFETGEYNYFLIDPSTGTGSAQMTSITIYYTSSSGSEGGDDPDTPGEGGGEDPNPDPEEPGTGTSGEVTFVFDTDQGLNELGIAKPNASAGTNLGSNVYTKAPINMTATDGGTATRVWNSSGATTLRVYKSTGSLTFSSEATINKIVFNTSITATASVGTLSGTTWTGEAKEVTFTFTANATIKTITVAYTAPSSGGGSEEPEPVIVKTLKSIAVSGQKTTFEQGDIFKFDGTCTATYSVTKDGVALADETAEVNPTSVSAPDMNTLGTQTITVTYETVSTTYDITITENEVTPGTYNVLLDNVLWNVASGQQTASVESMSGKANDITFYTTKGSSQMYANATQTRFYKDQTFTISVPEGYLIKSIAFAEPASDKKWEGSITVNTGTYTDGTKTWTGSAQEVTYTFGAQNRIANAEITYEVAPVEPTKTLTSIEITTPATQTTFWQGETFNYNGLVVTAHYSDAADEVVTPTVTGSTATAGTATVNVSYKEQSTSYTITVKAIPNTKETAYSVADAFDIIDKLGAASGVFISGTISQVDSYSDQYKSITYWISADGTTTKQLQVYSGKGLESADFAALTDLSVGDQVIVCGNLKKYSGTYEFDKNNYLASHTPTTKDPAGLAYATTSYTANVGEAFTTPGLTNPHNLVVTYSTSDASKATVDANTGAVTIVAAGVVTITAATTGDATHDAGSASYTITITDLSLLIATLPFEFNGKQADIEGTAGMTHSGIDADDYKSAPYLKMNTTGDWLIICFDSEPEKLSYDIKNNSFSGGTFSVQESADGETYTDVEVHTEITNTQNEEHTLLSTSRYVKFIYTEKVDGNVGLGNIKITKPDLRAEAGIAWNPSAVTLTQGDVFTAPTLNNPYSVAGITYESSNHEVATVTAEGVIALATGIGTATITATFAGDATYKPATATCTITVNEYIETLDGEWQLVTDASKLQAGMEIIIASVADAGTVKTMGEQGNNNRSAVASTVDGDKLNPAVGTTVITLEDCQLYEGLFALKTKDGYLYAASSSSNHLKSQEGINNNACWTITITEGVAAVAATYSSNRKIMRYNETSDLFSCYASGQKDIALYAKKPAHTRTTSAGRYGTICLPGNIVKCLGATLYEVAGKDGLRVVFDEVLTPEAGMPYIFLAHNTEVLFYCGDETAAAGNYNSLYGTFSVMQDAQLDGMYMVQNNKIVKCAATGCGVAEYRAYFNGTELEALGSAPAPMPGRRRITMGTESENAATGTEDVIAPEGQTLKLIENGQLIIIRGGEKFNAQGIKF